MHRVNRAILAVCLACSVALSTFATVVYAVLPPVTNFAKVTVSAGYSSVATSIVLVPGHGGKLPATFPFPLVWWNCSDFGAPEDDPLVEIISVTARATDTLTVVRGQESTAASNHNTGGKTYCMILAITKAMWDAVRTDIAAGAGGLSRVIIGAGSPEGTIIAGVGTLYIRTDGSGDTTLYRKQTGAGNTGWIAQPITTNWAVPGSIGATTPGTGVFTTLTAKQVLTTLVSPVYGATVAIDGSLGTRHLITVTNSSGFTILNPTNSSDTQLLIVMVKNSSGGVMATPTWDTAYKLAAFIKPVNGTRRAVTFAREGSNWYEISCSPEVPN